MIYRQIIITILLITVSIVGCTSAPTETVSTSTPMRDEPALIVSTNSPIPGTSTTILQSSPTSELAGYEFPDSIDPAKRYLFYLHGKIIEDQGLPAVSPDYGEYEYQAILSKLETAGIVVISELRPINTDSSEYARIVLEQINVLLEANVPSEFITVAGASKGAAIAAVASHILKNEKINFVLLGGCNPEFVEVMNRNQMYLYGNVLSIYDSADDEYAGSCEELFFCSEENGGLNRHDEIVLQIGTGHGILYKPLDEWINPTIQWAMDNTD